MVTVELRSLNHRSLEVVCHLPLALQPWEDRARDLIRRQFHRGRITCTATYQCARADAGAQLKIPVARRYYTQLRHLQRTLRLEGAVTLTHLLALPRVLTTEELPQATILWPVFQRALTAALQQLAQMRRREGRTLARELQRRAATIARTRTTIATRAPAVVQQYQERLQRRLADLVPAGAVDAQRLATEVATFAANADITEELTRLASHLASFQQALRRDGEQGRTLDFMLQEMGREVNTLGSKANDYPIAERVIVIKGELDKLREQVQNIE